MERLARRCGFDAVSSAMPPSDSKLLAHIRKEHQRKQRRKHGAGSESGSQVGSCGWRAVWVRVLGSVTRVGSGRCGVWRGAGGGQRVGQPGGERGGGAGLLCGVTWWAMGSHYSLFFTSFACSTALQAGDGDARSRRSGAPSSRSSMARTARASQWGHTAIFSDEDGGSEGDGGAGRAKWVGAEGPQGRGGGGKAPERAGPNYAAYVKWRCFTVDVLGSGLRKCEDVRA